MDRNKRRHESHVGDGRPIKYIRRDRKHIRDRTHRKDRRR